MAAASERPIKLLSTKTQTSSYEQAVGLLTSSVELDSFDRGSSRGNEETARMGQQHPSTSWTIILTLALLTLSTLSARAIPSHRATAQEGHPLWKEAIRSQGLSTNEKRSLNFSVLAPLDLGSSCIFSLASAVMSTSQPRFDHVRV